MGRDRQALKHTTLGRSRRDWSYRRLSECTGGTLNYECYQTALATSWRRSATTFVSWRPGLNGLLSSCPPAGLHPIFR